MFLRLYSYPQINLIFKVTHTCANKPLITPLAYTLHTIHCDTSTIYMFQINFQVCPTYSFIKVVLYERIDNKHYCTFDSATHYEWKAQISQ